MKGQKIIDQIVRAEMPDMEQVREKCVMQVQTESREQRSRRQIRRFGVSAVAAAAVLCLCLFGNTILTPQGNNSFFVEAYALEQQADGSITLSDSTVDSSGESSSICLGIGSPGNLYLYSAISLNIEGENIKSIEFIGENDCMFLITDVLTENGELVMHEDREYTIMDYDGNEMAGLGSFTILSMENLGNSFTLDDMDTLAEGAFLFTEDTVLFAGKSVEDDNALNLTISAVATFNDGTTQEQILTIAR